MRTKGEETMGRLFEIVKVDEETPVSYVGVHPVKWHKHPEQPAAGFKETAYTVEFVEEMVAVCKEVLYLFERTHHEFSVFPGPSTKSKLKSIVDRAKELF
jgi:hypothetical protein